MCVGFTNGYKDFEPQNWHGALAAMVPGSAISFNRLSSYHFAIFLGCASSIGGSPVEPIPLLCHLYADDSNSRPSVRLSDLRDVVHNSTIRVYKCSCTASRRMDAITKSVARVGESSQHISAVFTSESFVRQVINNQDISYQALWTAIVPFVQLPRLAIGGLMAAASGQAQSANSLREQSCLVLTNPGMDRIQIDIFSGGLAATMRR